MVLIPKATTERPLMKHQAQYLRWCVENRVQHPACFMEMRLGKTLANIRLVTKVWKTQGACLVVAPTNVIEAWEKELTLENEPFIIAAGLSYQKRIEAMATALFSGKRMWVLINYESLRTVPGMVDMEWHVVCLDESTKIKNPKAMVTKLVCRGFRKVHHRIILSGLPSPEGDLDLFTQFKFLRNKFCDCSNFYEFRYNFFQPGEWGSGWEHLPKAKGMIRKEVYEAAFVMRRQDAGMDKKKVRENRSVQMEVEQSKAYKQIEREFATWVQDGEVDVLKETMHVIVKHMWLHRAAGGCDANGVFKWKNKAHELLDLLKGELAQEPVVVWFRFNDEIKAVHKMLTENGIPSRMLMGEAKQKDRDEMRKWFRESPIPGRVILCQVELAKYGIDLSVSDTAIYYSRSYSGEANAQSEDRILHPMKDSPLLYLDLVTKDSIDEDIVYITSQKVTDAKMLMTRVNESIIRRHSNAVK